MAQQQSFLSRIGEGVGDNKWGLMGAVGGTLLATTLFPGGGILSMIVGLLAGGMLGGMMGDKGDGLVNGLMGRKQGTHSGQQAARNGRGLMFAQGHEFHTVDNLSASSAADLPHYKIAVDPNHGNKKEALVTDVQVMAASGPLNITLDKPVILPRDVDGKPDQYSPEAKALNQQVNGMFQKIKQATAQESAAGLQITAQEMDMLRNGGLSGLRTNSVEKYNQHAPAGERMDVTDVKSHGTAPVSTPATTTPAANQQR